MKNPFRHSEMKLCLGANNISSSSIDLSLVTGIQRKLNTAPATEAAADMKKRPFIPRIGTRTGNVCNGLIIL